jgi:hypothetical protein
LTSVTARVLTVDRAAQRATLRLGGGEQRSFPLALATGFVPLAGQEVVALLGDDGTVERVHLPAHPSKPEPSAAADVSWVSVLRRAPLRAAPAALAELLGSTGAPPPRIVVHPGRTSDRRSVEVIWPLMHMLLAEEEGSFSLQRADTRLLGPDFSPGSHRVSFLPAAVDPGVERRLAGGALADPWAPEGRLRRASRLLAALLRSDGAGVVLHRAGELVLSREDALARLGDLGDPEARPFGAWIDWALTPDRRAYRTLGMSTLGGEDLEIVIARPEAEVELDSAESALLFACHLQVRENRFLGDGEVLHVPRDVRVGARGASAKERTGYRYLAHRGHARVQLVRG